MLDKGDINKIHMKENNHKGKDGAIYGTKDKITDFHSLESITIESYQNNLLNILNTLFGSDETLEGKIQVIKEVLLMQQQKIEALEKKVNDYLG
jgi:hypothetical protein